MFFFLILTVFFFFPIVPLDLDWLVERVYNVPQDITPSQTQTNLVSNVNLIISLPEQRLFVSLVLLPELLPVLQHLIQLLLVLLDMDSTLENVLLVQLVNTVLPGRASVVLRLPLEITLSLNQEFTVLVWVPESLLVVQLLMLLIVG